MDRAAFVHPSGHLVTTIEGAPAFVPHDLPPALDLARLALPMSRASQAMGELRGACRRLPNPWVLIRPLQRAEALTSSAMEGTFTTDDNLLLAEAGLVPSGDGSTQEVVNYIRAIDNALEMLKTLPICHRLIRRSHEILLEGLSASRGAAKAPGDYKTSQNWIGGRTVNAARFVPPPPAEAQACMDRLEAYLNRPDRAYPTPIMDLALVHYQFETIHPFSDGNGRVGRMLISLMAVQGGLLDVPALYISPIMEHYKDEYIDRLFDVSARSAWTPWLAFFFERITESCFDTVAVIDRLLALHDELRERARQSSRSGSAMTLVDYMFEAPALTVNDAAKRLSVTYAAAKSAIDRLIELGIADPIPNTYPQLYYSARIRRAARPGGAARD